MKSFKVSKHSSEKEAAKSLGGFVAVIGVLVFLTISVPAGAALTFLGLVALLVGATASE